MRSIARYSPITYVLEGMRSLLSDGWDWAAIGKALLAIAMLGLVSQTLAPVRAAQLDVNSRSPHSDVWPPQLGARRTSRSRPRR